MFSATSKYAIRAVLYLGLLQKKNKEENKEFKVGIKKLAEDLKIPSYFLGKIMQTLAKNKILTSYKGPNGGFSFNRDINDIYLIDIVRIFDGDDVFHTCLLGLHLCNNENFNKDDCPFAKDIDVCVARINDYLSTTSVGKIVNSLEKLDDVFMI